jgi:nucleotide-binding universal stress UspA family protein
MATQLLMRSIEECLNAGAFLEEQRQRGEAVEKALERVKQSRADLREQVDKMDGPAAKPVVDAARRYLAAEAAFESGGDGRLSPPATVFAKLHEARRSLAAQLRAHLLAQASSTTTRVGEETRPLPFSRRVLIAIDGSTPSTWAIGFGGQLAEALSAHVMLVHVIEPVTYVTNELVYATQDLQKEHRELCQGGRELLDKAGAALPHSVQVDTLLREGSPVGEIINAARTWEADLVVMGTRGRGRFTQFLLGSVAEAVIRAAPCPVLTVGREVNSIARQGVREGTKAC